MLKSKSGGYGLGFIVGNLLFSSGHVFSAADGRIFCTQDGRLVDITEQKSGKVHLHPNYENPKTFLFEWNYESHTSDENESMENHARSGFDVGYIRLSGSVKSDFELEPSLDYGEGQEAVVRMDEQGEFSITRTGELTFGAGFSFSSQKGEIELGPSANLDLIADYSFISRPGDSGAPYVVIKPNGRFLVLGVVRGVQPNLTLAAGLLHSSPTVAVHTSQIQKWLQESLPQLFDFSGSCEEYLVPNHIPKNK